MERSDSLDTADPVTWAMLLTYWTRLARSAVALPEEGEGGDWKRSIPDIVGLQALACALGDAERLAADELAVAIDRASFQIDAHEQTLRRRWGERLPNGLAEMIADARIALVSAASDR
ncbi:MAG: hypothetical protein AAGB51_14430 [Planctomycetota bacterium]